MYSRVCYLWRSVHNMLCQDNVFLQICTRLRYTKDSFFEMADSISILPPHVVFYCFFYCIIHVTILISNYWMLSLDLCKHAHHCLKTTACENMISLTHLSEQSQSVGRLTWGICILSRFIPFKSMGRQESMGCVELEKYGNRLKAAQKWRKWRWLM